MNSRSRAPNAATKPEGDARPQGNREKEKLRWLVLGSLIVGIVFVLGMVWRTLEGNPDVAFLPARTPAEWIVYPTPADAPGKWAAELSTEFKHTFILESSALKSSATLAVRAFKRAAVTINGKPLLTPVRNQKNWKQPALFDAAPFLRPGTNEISVTVFNDAALPALWLTLDAGKAQLVTDPTWRSSCVGAVWKPSQLASQPLAIKPGNRLFGGERTLSGLRKNLPLLVGLFAVLFVLSAAIDLFCQRRDSSVRPSSAATLWSAALRSPVWLLFIALVLAWIAIWGNNLGCLPFRDGFDVEEHLKYVDYVLNRHRLPLANEGFQMYQPPLYYMASAALLSIFRASTFDANGIFILRLFGLTCGIATFTLVFLSLRAVFPASPSRQVFGLLLAGCLSPNLYLCQYITNEILSTALAAACGYACLRVLFREQISAGQYAFTGLLLGAAMLAKSSAIVLPPVVFGVLAWNLYVKRVRNPKQWAKCFAPAAVSFLALCGWHYVRVAARFGNPLITNVDPASGFNFWQQPGFRTSSSYLRMGESLLSPFFSGFAGVPDALYSTWWGDGLFGGTVDMQARPPWNYDLMAAGYVLALLPMAAILIGLAISAVRFLRGPDTAGFFLIGTMGGYGMLLLYFSLKVPAYSAPKAFYGSGALVAVCALGTIGWDFLLRAPGVFRWTLHAVLGLWAVTTFSSFWIRANEPYTQMVIIRGFSEQGRHDLAISRLSKILKQKPEEPRAGRLLALEYLQTGQVENAARLAEQFLSLTEGDADWHLARSLILVVQGQAERAVAEARRAVELAPDHRLAWEGLRDWLQISGNKPESIAACREALRIAPTDGKLHSFLASAEADLGHQAEAQFHLRLAQQLRTP